MTVQVTPAVLRATAHRIGAASTELRGQATALEGSCEAVPKVGDVQAGLPFGQAHYDWVQTRFEDLMASADELRDVANLLTGAAELFAAQDRRTEQTINGILAALGSRPVRGGHP